MNKILHDSMDCPEVQPGDSYPKNISGITCIRCLKIGIQEENDKYQYYKRRFLELTYNKDFQEILDE